MTDSVKDDHGLGPAPTVFVHACSRDDRPQRSRLFAVPGSPGACRDAWDDILLHQLDYRFRPCNFVELMPRLLVHVPGTKGRGA